VAGPVEAALRAELAALSATGSAETGEAGTPTSGTLAQIAVNLAQRLDEDAGLATAGIAKQLASCLSALGLAPRERDPAEDATVALIARLSTPLLDPAAAGAADVRPRRRGGGRADRAAAAAVGKGSRGRRAGG
jgi:hypothetical protein